MLVLYMVRPQRYAAPPGSTCGMIMYHNSHITLARVMSTHALRWSSQTCRVTTVVLWPPQTRQLEIRWY